MSHASRGNEMTFEQKAERAFRTALDLYRQKPNWITFYREVLGVDGAVNHLFTADELSRFESTEEHKRIQQMLTELRDSENIPDVAQEPTKVITVRMPTSLHESLRAEAHARKTSMNRLCIAKLIGLEGGESAAESEATAKSTAAKESS